MVVTKAYRLNARFQTFDFFIIEYREHMMPEVGVTP
jgi:hypothetical protein